jgi:enoyl-CoA hydratase/carnithine racemase
MTTVGYEHLKVDISDDIAVVALDRADKRNAVNKKMLSELDRFFSSPPGDVKAAVLIGHGEHFCAGLDLQEVMEIKEPDPLRDIVDTRYWHSVMQRIQFGGLPVVTAMQGAVIGGGLEIATATHVRVAEPSTFYQLPEGSRGIFVGGGATVRVARVIGADRMTEMLLTGRRYSAEEGQHLGLSHYLVEEGQARRVAEELARKISANAPISNYLTIQAIPRISDMSAEQGLFTETLAAIMSHYQAAIELRPGIAEFLGKKQEE